MIDYTYFNRTKDVNHGIHRTKYGSYSDTIYTFDIETTSLFLINGKWQRFDYSIKDYRKIEKRAIPYIGMFGVEGDVYYFRDMKEGFLHFLNTISNPELTKTVWIFNAGYEFGFYSWILSDYTIIDMIASDVRKPISFKIKELNIIIRCALKLTELTLANAAVKYTDVEKKTGDLDYSLERSYKSHLTDTELGYCEYDIITLWKVVDAFRKKYGHIKKIPLTHTGEMRFAYRKRVPASHNRKCISNLPSVPMYRKQHDAFWGGICHGNILHIKEVLYELFGYDIASSYPTILCCYMVPVEKFKKIKVENDHMYPGDKYAKIYKVTFEHISSNYYNHYIPTSKCTYISGGTYDNGRVISADILSFDAIVDVDLEIIKEMYFYTDIEIEEIYVAKKDYMPKYFIQFVLDLYKNKTELKNIPEMKDFYDEQKSLLNSCYGASVTSLVKSSVIFKEGEWFNTPLTDALIQETLDKKKEAHNNLFIYAQGIWITAYARQRLMQPIINSVKYGDGGLDTDIIYYDTDSHKMLNGEKYRYLYEEENKKIDEKLKAMCEHYNIDFELTRPKDKNGIPHPLGQWECEYPGNIEEFVTLGSKRYCMRVDGELEITVSGVNKKTGVKALHNDIKNFNDKLVFDYEESGKLCHTYVDDQEDFTFTDIDGNEVFCHWPSAIILEPTTYSMGLSSYFDAIIQQYMNSQCWIDDFLEEQERLRTKH